MSASGSGPLREAADKAEARCRQAQRWLEAARQRVDALRDAELTVKVTEAHLRAAEAAREALVAGGLRPREQGLGYLRLAHSDAVAALSSLSSGQIRSAPATLPEHEYRASLARVRLRLALARLYQYGGSQESNE